MLSIVSGFLLLVAFEGPPLHLPWACGKVESCTQGHQGGSHTGNSAFAWDFVLSDGEEIWSASAGVVTHARMDSNVGGCNQSYATEGNFITIDHGDGTSIIYAHMRSHSSPLEIGDEVEVGDLIGLVGQTGYVCGAHLHMAVQQQCDLSHCASVPASFATAGDPDAGGSFESDNCPVCSKALDGGTTVIDDQDAGCLLRETKAWWSSTAGRDGHHFYTLATDARDDVTRGTWVLDVVVPGEYEVEVFVPDADADTSMATYVVQHAGGMDEVVIDQSAEKGWQPLGRFGFDGGAEERIVLGDATGENIDTLGRKVAYDAMRFTFVPGASAGSDTSSADPGAPPDLPGGSDSGDAMGDAGTTGDPMHATDETGDGAGDGLPPGFGDDPPEGGCACRATMGGGGPTWAWWLPVLGVASRARRRRAHHRSPASHSPTVRAK